MRLTYDGRYPATPQRHIPVHTQFPAGFIYMWKGYCISGGTHGSRRRMLLRPPQRRPYTPSNPPAPYNRARSISRWGHICGREIVSQCWRGTWTESERAPLNPSMATVHTMQTPSAIYQLVQCTLNFPLVPYTWKGDYITVRVVHLGLSTCHAISGWGD